MSTYRIEQYILYSEPFEVEANSEAEAIASLFAGYAEPIGDSSFETVVEYKGMPAKEHPELVKQLRTLGITVKNVIPSVCSIEKLD